MSEHPEESRLDVVMMALELTPAQAAKAVEVLSRTAMGLALDGCAVQFRVDQSACDCEDADERAAP